MYSLRRVLFVSLISLLTSQARAQSLPYEGWRVAVFDMQLLKQKKSSLTLRCRLANTGRLSLEAQKIPNQMQIEFDSVALPSLLHGFEMAIGEAVRKQCPSLTPGAVSPPILLQVPIKSRNQTFGSNKCAELTFDTVFVESWNERDMQLRFFLKNTGEGPAELFSKKSDPVVKAYFVNGTKLTRGAIPAGTTSFKIGRETLDGLLFPGQVLEGVITLNLQHRSKFSQNIALEFDPAQVVDECSRAGNVWVLQTRF